MTARRGEKRERNVSRCRQPARTCRHSTQPNPTAGSLPDAGPCAGGCDACDRARHAGAGGIQERDVTNEARLLLAAMEALKVRFGGVCRVSACTYRLVWRAVGGMGRYRCTLNLHKQNPTHPTDPTQCHRPTRQAYGVTRVTQLLRGSRNKDIAPWMLTKTAPDGSTVLHGALKSRSDGWLKGLHGLLVGKGFIELKSMQVRSMLFNGQPGGVVPWSWVGDSEHATTQSTSHANQPTSTDRRQPTPTRAPAATTQSASPPRPATASSTPAAPGPEVHSPEREVHTHRS
jgi:hypothetical protein